MNQNSRRTLKEFLLSREDDIALEMEDFGNLKSVFQDVIGREPEKVAQK
jgi:hypothetical protein